MKITGIRKYLFFVVLFLSNIAILGAEFYGVIMTQMYSTYGEWAVNLCMSIPGLLGMVSCLIFGKVCDKVDKKIVFILGLVLFGITGSNLALSANSIVMIIMSCFNGGVCYGMVSVAAVGIITKCFADEGARGKVMGYYNGAMALTGAVMMIIYGQFAEINWTLAPVINWAVVGVAVLAVFAIPSCKPEPLEAGAKLEKAVAEKGWAKRLIPIIAAFFCVSFAFVSVNNFIDLYVTANGLGGPSFTSMCNVTQTVCSFVFNCLFGFTYGKLKTKLTIPAYFSMAAAVLLLIFFPIRPVVLIACGLLGIGWGSLYSFWFFRTTVVVPENMIGTATGLVTTFNSLSYFPVPYVLTGAMAMLSTDNSREVFPLYAGILIAALVLSVIINFRPGTKVAEAGVNHGEKE